ncbi:MAG: regulatory protein RecX [Gammaproteobacteria bacterium]
MPAKRHTAKNAAIALLARREHARGELAAKLARRFPETEITAALDSLAQSGMQSDLRFARAYLELAGKKFGREKLRQTLRARGVADADADAAMDEINEDECARAAAVLTAKYGDTALREEKSCARALRFLETRGFMREDAETALARQNRKKYAAE